MPDFKTALGGQLSESVHQIETTKSRGGRGDIKAGKQMQSGGSYNGRSNLQQVEALFFPIFGRVQITLLL